MENRIGVIAIDGPAGAGKSTVAKAVAAKLSISYLDTGALYRALAFYLDEFSILPEEDAKLSKALFDVYVEISGGRVLLNGKDVSDSIRLPRIDRIASLYSALPSVREKLLSLQREQALKGALVADGRDVGTVVFPYAPVKIFLTARPEVRARRRFDELASRGLDVDYGKILEEIVRRDAADTERAISPLRKAPDAVLLDTSDLDVEQVVDRVVQIAKERANV